MITLCCSWLLIKYVATGAYADDMELHCSNSDLFSAQRGLQDDLDSMYFWLRTNQLSLNVGKSHVMLIGSRQKLRDSDLCVSINGRQLSRILSLKYLGVYIDEHLTWQRHTQYVYQKVQSRLHCFYHLCPLSDTLLGRLYCAFILAILDYCGIHLLCSTVKGLNVFILSFVHYFQLHKLFSLYFS